MHPVKVVSAVALYEADLASMLIILFYLSTASSGQRRGEAASSYITAHFADFRHTPPRKR